MKYPIIPVVFVALAILGMGGVIAYFSNCHTPEWEEGYQTGYEENNTSKYQAACNLTDDIFLTCCYCTQEQYDYANGYIAGYEQNQVDCAFEHVRSENENKMNQSLEILGI